MSKKSATKKPLNISVLGPPLSGKGTQAEMLSKVLQLPHLVMSQMLKETAKENKKIGEIILPMMAAGQLVPSEILDRILKYNLSKKKNKQGFVIEGSPRRLNEAKYLESLAEISCMVHLIVPLKEMIRRAGGRRTCACGASFHIEFNPSKKAGICDICGKKLFIREDDKPETIKKRMKVYEKESAPAAEYFKKRGKYIPIDGVPPISEVSEQILRKLIKFFFIK